jgi:hypothetical protein
VFVPSGGSELEKERHGFYHIAIRMPRQSGHTQAAIMAARKYPTGVIVTETEKNRRLVTTRAPGIHDRITDVPSLIRGDSRFISPESRTYFTLKGGIEFFIFDGPLVISRDRHQELIHRYKPKLVFFLGDCYVN